MARVSTGLDELDVRGLELLAGRRVGLVTNHSALTADGRHAVDVLREREIALATLFAPEHGIRGTRDAIVPDEVHESGLVVHSLYGATHEPTPEMLRGIDVLIFDIQDVGARFYTYVSTLALVQAAAGRAGIPFVVLDRPVPINGASVEGPMLERRFASFIGMQEVPIRHGMTVGELARLRGRAHGWPEPVVVAMHGWRREMWLDETGIRWVPPSPNLRTLGAMALYPGLCLIEGTNLSEGRGTDRPFEQLGAPWLDARAAVRELRARRIAGVELEETRFVPSSSKHAEAECAGVAIGIADRDALRPVELGVHLLDVCRRAGGAAFQWLSDANGFRIDRLCGTDAVRTALDGGRDVAEIVAGWEPAIAEFGRARQRALLYDGPERTSRA